MIEKEKISILLDELTKNDFKTFIIRALQVVDPNTKFLPNWHIDYICDILMAVEKREIKRLIINIPPRNLKSIIASVAFPAWILAKNPSERIIASSYSGTLSIKHSTDTRLVMQSDWYRKIFPDSIIAKDKQNTKTKFITNSNGYRFATSTNGTLTGEGGNFLIVDDPHNPVKIDSKKDRESTINWFQNVFASRLNDKKNGIIMIIMQRIHKEDLTGFLLEKSSDWYHMNLPIVAEKNEIISFNNIIYQERKIGDLLHPTREGKKEIEKIKSELGANTFMSQYQQAPPKVQNGMININKLTWKDCSDLHFEQFFISIDCATGTSEEHDFSAIGIFSEIEEKIFLLEMHRVKLEFPELKIYIINLLQKFEKNIILIEEKIIGISLIQELKSQNFHIIGIKPTNSKENRLRNILGILESPNFIINKFGNWQFEFEQELSNFPKGKNDDQIDSISQFLNWYTKWKIELNSKSKESLPNEMILRFI